MLTFQYACVSFQYYKKKARRGQPQGQDRNKRGRHPDTTLADSEAEADDTPEQDTLQLDGAAGEDPPIPDVGDPFLADGVQPDELHDKADRDSLSRSADSDCGSDDSDLILPSYESDDYADGVNRSPSEDD